MKTHNNDTIRILNDLIETCEDGEHGFRLAAEDAKDAELRSLLQRYSDQRRDFVRELRALVTQLGGNADDHGSVTGKLHRGWINLKAAISSNEPHAVLAECERGEDAAVKAYREALEKLDDVRAREVVLQQSAQVQSAHDTVRDLRDSPMYQKSR
jgi:uncharacterized protein (TIGR02284 family)